jgi:hypothetical protein
MISHRDATRPAPLSAARKMAAGAATMEAVCNQAAKDRATPLTDRCNFPA